ncbi:MAG: (Fe-S)-binding protein [Anaerorhabdus sp.]
MIEAIVMMLAIGAALGIILGIASKVFYVAQDNRIEDVTALLPGYNCGGCGYPGCSGLAEALVGKEAEVTLCKPAKPEQREQVNEYLAKLG